MLPPSPPDLCSPYLSILAAHGAKLHTDKVFLTVGTEIPSFFYPLPSKMPSKQNHFEIFEPQYSQKCFWTVDFQGIFVEDISFRKVDFFAKIL